jgi:hypothetical protein
VVRPMPYLLIPAIPRRSFRSCIRTWRIRKSRPMPIYGGRRTRPAPSWPSLRVSYNIPCATPHCVLDVKDRRQLLDETFHPIRLRLAIVGSVGGRQGVDGCCLHGVEIGVKSQDWSRDWSQDWTRLGRQRLERHRQERWYSYCRPGLARVWRPILRATLALLAFDFDSPGAALPWCCTPRDR